MGPKAKPKAKAKQVGKKGTCHPALSGLPKQRFRAKSISSVCSFRQVDALRAIPANSVICVLTHWHQARLVDSLTACLGASTATL